MNGLSFGYPGILGLAGIFVPLVVWALARGQHRHRKALAAFGEEPLFAASSALPSPWLARSWAIRRLRSRAADATCWSSWTCRAR